MKKIIAIVLLWPLVAFAQSLPSPTFQNFTVNGTATIPHAAITGGTISGLSSPVPVASGGTGATTATGTGSAVLQSAPALLGAATFGSTWRSLQYTSTPGATQTQAYGGRILVTSGPTDNAIVGAIVQDGTNGNSFPTGVTGYGMMNNAGNQAFGVFGQCDIGYSGGSAVAGTCSNEFDTFNYSGAPSTQLPPNMAFGTSQVNAIGLQLDAYGNYASSIGLMLGYGSQAFSTGIYLNPQSSTVNGILVDATSSNGPTTSAEIRNSGSGVNLNLLTAGSTTSSNPVLQVMNSSRSVKASINQGGGAALTQVQINEPANGTQSLLINATSDSNGANIALNGNGGTTPNKYIRSANGQFQIGNSAYSSIILTLTDAGVLSTTGSLQLPVTTVSALPTCNTAAKGLMYAVSDFSGTPTYNATLTGGGSTVLPVFCNGSSWTQH